MSPGRYGSKPTQPVSVAHRNPAIVFILRIIHSMTSRIKGNEVYMLKAKLFIRATRCRQSGFTLLEVLITLIVLSVGLLGLAGLQTMSLTEQS